MIAGEIIDVARSVAEKSGHVLDPIPVVEGVPGTELQIRPGLLDLVARLVVSVGGRLCKRARDTNQPVALIVAERRLVRARILRRQLVARAVVGEITDSLITGTRGLGDLRLAKFIVAVVVNLFPARRRRGKNKIGGGQVAARLAPRQITVYRQLIQRHLSLLSAAGNRHDHKPSCGPIRLLRSQVTVGIVSIRRRSSARPVTASGGWVVVVTFPAQIINKIRLKPKRILYAGHPIQTVVEIMGDIVARFTAFCQVCFNPRVS